MGEGLAPRWWGIHEFHSGGLMRAATVSWRDPRMEGDRRCEEEAMFYHMKENKTGGFNLLQILGVRPLNRGCHKGYKSLRGRQLLSCPDSHGTSLFWLLFLWNTWL